MFEKNTAEPLINIKLFSAKQFKSSAVMNHHKSSQYLFLSKTFAFSVFANNPKVSLGNATLSQENAKV